MFNAYYEVTFNFEEYLTMKFRKLNNKTETSYYPFLSIFCWLQISMSSNLDDLKIVLPENERIKC